jgi:muramoyltetrapeptide carboxypeptidase
LNFRPLEPHSSALPDCATPRQGRNSLTLCKMRVKVNMKTIIKDRLDDIVLPNKLQPGDTIGIAAPASPFESETFDAGIDVLRKMGFVPKIPGGLFEKEGYLAGSEAHRAELLHQLFLDDTVKGILCARGGFGSLRLLSSIDLDLIKNNPKPIIGFSDITSLLSTITQQCGLVTFHGPMVTSLANADEPTLQAFINAISMNDGLEIRANPGVSLRTGIGTAPVAGGNLTTLCHLVGTPFQPSWRGHILFLEDRNEAAYRIDRMLTQLKLAGCLDGLTGVMLGSFKDCGDRDAIFRLVMDVFDEDGVPIAAGFEVGHGSRNVTLPIGLTATLNADQCTLVYHTTEASLE